MSNKITIELCAEDRARLDRLAEALELRSGWVPQDIRGPEPQETPTTTLDSAPAPAEVETETTTPAEPEAPTEPERTQEEKDPEPAVTLAQIQQKVVQLAAGADSTKKAKVREIINAYASKVSDLKYQPDKWLEIWDKLDALGSEG